MCDSYLEPGSLGEWGATYCGECRQVKIPLQHPGKTTNRSGMQNPDVTVAGAAQRQQRGSTESIALLREAVLRLTQAVDDLVRQPPPPQETQPQKGRPPPLLPPHGKPPPPETRPQWEMETTQRETTQRETTQPQATPYHDEIPAWAGPPTSRGLDKGPGPAGSRMGVCPCTGCVPVNGIKGGLAWRDAEREI
ncbi:unnamed protein product [Boreogadus saida]